MSWCLSGSDAPMALESHRHHLSQHGQHPAPHHNHGRRLFLPNPCFFFPPVRQSLGCPLSLGATGWKPAWSWTPVAPLGKYFWDHLIPYPFAPSYKGWASGATSLPSDYNWDLSLHDEWGNRGGFKYHPCYAQGEINPRWNSKSPRSYRNPDRHPGGATFTVKHYKVFLLSLIL